MGVDMDREWRQLPNGARRLLVAVLELIKTDFGYVPPLQPDGCAAYVDPCGGRV